MDVSAAGTNRVKYELRVRLCTCNMPLEEGRAAGSCVCGGGAHRLYAQFLFAYCFAVPVTVFVQCVL